MKLSISETDSPAVGRLKLIYLFPFFLVALIPVSLFLGFMEWGTEGFRTAWNILKTGRP